MGMMNTWESRGTPRSTSAEKVYRPKVRTAELGGRNQAPAAGNRSVLLRQATPGIPRCKPAARKLNSPLQPADRRLARLETSDPSALQSVLAAFLLLLMVVVYLFSRRVTALKPNSRGARIVRKKEPTFIIHDEQL